MAPCFLLRRSSAVAAAAGALGDDLAAGLGDSFGAAVFGDSFGAAVLGDGFGAAVLEDSLAAVFGDKFAATPGDRCDACDACDSFAARMDSSRTRPAVSLLVYFPISEVNEGEHFGSVTSSKVIIQL